MTITKESLEEASKLVGLKIKDSDVELLRRMFLVYHMTVYDRPLIPPTRDELAMVGIDKKILQRFEKCGFCETKTRIVQEKGKGTIGRVIVNMTDLGNEICDNVFKFKRPQFPESPPEKHPLSK